MYSGSYGEGETPLLTNDSQPFRPPGKVYMHSNQASRLITALTQAPELSTVAVREALAIGNPADVAMRQNRTWQASGDSRRILCERRSVQNRYGRKITLGFWRLVSTAANDCNSQGVA